jgi:hypothetical protein
LGKLQIVAVQSQLLAEHATDVGGVHLTAVALVNDAAPIEPLINLGNLEMRCGGEAIKPRCRVELA